VASAQAGEVSVIALCVHIVVNPGREAEAKALFAKLQEESRKEQGCILYQVHTHRDDARKFLVYEQYTDDSALDAHRNSPHFVKYAAEGVYTMIESREFGLYDPI
jgi:quinol monooxygenase YgiN